MKKTLLISLVVSQIGFFLLFPVWLELSNYLHPLVMAVVWFCITTTTLFLACLLKNIKIVVPINFVHGTILLYSVGLLVLLFFRPGGQSYGDINLIPLETIIFYLSGHVSFLIALYNLSANVGLFIPFGLYYQYVAKNPSFKKVIILSIISVSLIESTQFLTKRGSLDIDDLILNIFGVTIGYLIFPIIKKVFKVKGNS